MGQAASSAEDVSPSLWQSCDWGEECPHAAAACLSSRHSPQNLASVVAKHNPTGKSGNTQCSQVAQV